ncbi:MAG: ABC transporter substrate-binding protein [Duncaniella sp.]|nr:ABC transporter substrate-binding protein [Duncaniella sp.]
MHHIPHFVTRNSYLILIFLLLSSCGRGASTRGDEVTGDTLTTCAKLLTLVDCGNYTVADVRDPWDTTRLLGRYILVDRDSEVPGSLPEGEVVMVPLENSIVYSDVHARAIGEVGGIKGVRGVADAGYFKTDEIVSGLADGSVTDIGPAMSPSIERIVEMNPDAILLSPYQNAGHGAVGQTGATIIECADYMESTPLGRAEWIKLLGKLYGGYEKADTIFASTRDRYEALRHKAAAVSTLPKVVTEQLTDGVWYVPGGCSYMARLLGDAAVVYPWSADTSTGSLQLDFATVFDRAHDAEFWLIRTWGHDLTLAELKSNNSLNAEMDAFNNGGVYAANTAEVPLFEDFPFHPDRLLREYLAIFHPCIMHGDTTLTYYKKVK